MALVDADEISGSPFRMSEATARDYLALMKPRVMSLVVFTALVGLLAAPVWLHPLEAAVAVIAIAVGAGASGVLNMWYDADIDAVMQRTAKRPLPQGLVRPHEALAFGVILSVLSVGTLGVLVNWTAGALLAFTIFFYAVVYTMGLKRWTPQNIVIGGAAGAFPPVIGWAAATGSVGIESLLLFGIIFLWTPPHFWALALFMTEDYERARVPMLPNVAGAAATRRQIFAYSVVVALFALLPWAMSYAGAVYGVSALALGAVLVRDAWRVVAEGEGADGKNRAAKRLFGFSLIYLFALFAAYLVDVILAASGAFA